MEPNRIKEILKKIEAGEREQPWMPQTKNSQFPISNSQLSTNDSMNNENSLKTEKLKIENSDRVPKWKITLLALIAFGLLAMISLGGYMVYQNYRGIMSADPETVIKAVGKLTELPQDEVPKVYTLNEVESLRENPFLKNAEVGDMILEYQQAKKAYIYRPSTKKIIGIAPLSQ